MSHENPGFGYQTWGSGCTDSHVGYGVIIKPKQASWQELESQVSLQANAFSCIPTLPKSYCFALSQECMF
jgi:hypothetical protein